LSAFSARTTSNPDQLQPPGIPITSFNPLLTPAMMAAQIGLLSAPNTLLSVMQAATAQNSLMHLNRCNDRDGQIVPAINQVLFVHCTYFKPIGKMNSSFSLLNGINYLKNLHRSCDILAYPEVRAKPGNESTPNKKEMNQSQLKLSEVGPT
uniref:Mediator of RNA polymerase II transcription subunit 25 n=1 Tax=Brugia timori TaxID=42155 RepID=A0A0R3R8B7_9BILA